jgi:hypothetical protein
VAAVKVGRFVQDPVTGSVDREAHRDRGNRAEVVAVKVGRLVQDPATGLVDREAHLGRDSRAAVAAKVGRLDRGRAVDSQGLAVDQKPAVLQVLAREEVGANLSGRRVHAALAELFRLYEKFP